MTFGKRQKTIIAAAIIAVLMGACFPADAPPPSPDTGGAASAPAPSVEVETEPPLEETPDALDAAINAAAAYLLDTVSSPRTGSAGGEWAILGLARSGYGVPESYYQDYRKAVEEYVAERDGVLHGTKFTEYSRVILGLTAAGYDPRGVAGFDLTAPLEDFGGVMRQGLNGAVCALLAIDSAGYPNSRREDYVAAIISAQLGGGGWNLTANEDEGADPDVTGMALQALAKYQHKPEVAEAVGNALGRLSEQQTATGGFSSWGNENVTSSVQVLVALCELGIPADDERFVKDGVTLIGNILSYQSADGGFRHSRGADGNSQMSAEQAFYGLVAARRALDGSDSLYRMDGR